MMAKLLTDIGMAALSGYGAILAESAGHRIIAVIFAIVAGVWLSVGIKFYSAERRQP